MKTLPEDMRRLRWLTIYGAMIANQVSELRRTRCESPDEDSMRVFAEEAGAVADMHDHVIYERNYDEDTHCSDSRCLTSPKGHDAG